MVYIKHLKKAFKEKLTNDKCSRIINSSKRIEKSSFSSVGRALVLWAKGPGFEPPREKWRARFFCWFGLKGKKIVSYKTINIGSNPITKPGLYNLDICFHQHHHLPGQHHLPLLLLWPPLQQVALQPKPPQVAILDSQPVAKRVLVIQTYSCSYC